jgi:hypothetical protein
MHRSASALICVAVAGLVASGCQSSQDKSAELAAKAAKMRKVQSIGLVIPKSDPRIQILGVTTLKSADRNAVVVQLKNKSNATISKIPIAVKGFTSGSKPVYTNTAYGTDTTLNTVSLLRPGQTVYWVNDQVTGAPPKRVTVRVGIGKDLPSAPADGVPIQARFFADPVSGTAYKGKIKNQSPLAQTRLVVYAVVTNAGRVTAAGRSIIDSLGPKGTKPGFFAVYFVGGDPRSGTMTTWVPPVTFKN